MLKSTNSYQIEIDFIDTDLNDLIDKNGYYQ